MAFSIVDAVIIPANAIFGLMVVTSKEAEDCARIKNEFGKGTVLYHWWLFCCLVTVVMGFVLSCFNICLCSLFLCYTCKNRRFDENGEGED